MTPFFREGHGFIEVVCGSMFSGKTEELIRRLRRALIAKQVVRVFKPALDRRYDETDIVSHSSLRIPSQVVSKAAEIPSPSFRKASTSAAASTKRSSSTRKSFPSVANSRRAAFALSPPVWSRTISRSPSPS
jgi:N-acetylglucosamine kinase-like BadF-type ATPase